MDDACAIRGPVFLRYRKRDENHRQFVVLKLLWDDACAINTFALGSDDNSAGSDQPKCNGTHANVCLQGQTNAVTYANVFWK